MCRQLQEGGDIVRQGFGHGGHGSQDAHQASQARGIASHVPFDPRGAVEHGAGMFEEGLPRGRGFHAVAFAHEMERSGARACPRR